MLTNPIDVRAWVEATRQERRDEAYSAITALVSWVDNEAQGLPLVAFERELLARLIALGCLLVALWLVLRMPEEVPQHVRDGKGWYTYRGIRMETVRTQFGAALSPRAAYELVSGKGARMVAPLDRAIGLAAGRMSLGVHLLVGNLAARMPFDEVGEILAQIGLYRPSKKSMLGIVDQLGPTARQFLFDMPAPAGDGEILVIQVDEKGAPMVSSAEHAKRCGPRPKRRGATARSIRRRLARERPRVRKKSGTKSKNAKMGTVAVVYTLRLTRSGKLEGPLNKRVIGTFHGRAHLFDLALHEAKKRGYGSKRTYFLADGALDLWKLQQQYFPKATPCVDWYHVCEYLWKAGTAAHRPGSKALAAWVHDRKEELRGGRIDDVLAELTRLGEEVAKRRKGRRKRVADAIRYVTNHREWMPYDKLLAADLDVATGIVEGAVNHTIGARLDGSMMRWSRARADHVLALRCIIVNGNWDDFAAKVMDEHSRCTGLSIPRITPDRPQEPYDAVRKAA